jgi:carboxyl-terminal processing protease
MRLFCAAILAAAFCGTPAPAQSELNAEQRKLNNDSFEQVWQTIRDKHWDPKLGGLDWQAVHDELRPKIESATTMDQAREVMSDMLSRLKQTHFGIVPSDAYREVSAATGAGERPSSSEGDPGLDVCIIDGRAYVASVDRGSAAEKRKVKTGWQIERIDGKNIDEALRKIREGLGTQSTLLDLMQRHAVMHWMGGDVGKPSNIDFLDGNGKRVSLKLDRGQPRGTLALLGNLPPLHFWVESLKVQDDVGYVRFNLFFEPETLVKEMQKIVTQCQGCNGMIVDVRGNPGGLGALSTGVAGWFVKQQGRLGHMTTRSGSINFPVFPRSDAFQGPLAILVDGSSASTSEVFAAGMKDMKRARIFGTRTAGAALPSVFAKLPNGDGFQYAIANYISEGGQPIEGIGVAADEEIQTTRQQLLDGKDPVVAAAVSWIRQQKK